MFFLQTIDRNRCRYVAWMVDKTSKCTFDIHVRSAGIVSYNSSSGHLGSDIWKWNHVTTETRELFQFTLPQRERL